MKKLVYIGIILWLLPLVLASTALEQEVGGLSTTLVGQSIPKSLSLFFSDAQVNFHVTLNNGEVTIIGLAAEQGKIKSLSVGELSKPTLRIYTDETTFLEIKNSSDPLKKLKSAMDKGTVTYEGVGFFNKIKFGLVSWITSILRPSAEDESGTVNTIEENNDEESGAEEDGSEEEVEVAEETTGEPETVEDTEEETSTGSTTHAVGLVPTGFEVEKLTIKVGDTVKWVNMRSEGIKKGMIIGGNTCREVKSRTLGFGEIYEYTFNTTVDCMIVDGIYTTETMKVIVE